MLRAFIWFANYNFIVNNEGEVSKIDLFENSV